ncbi:MAG: hypothetical protein JWN15_768 [Firmicutes bacterium]|nr:hypothetical protein [Bacillota bacterium]
MKVTMLLADAAQAAEGKLFILGGGWSVTGPSPVPSAMAIKIEVPWNEANRKHKWLLSLVDSDGQPVLAQTPTGEGPIEVGGEFEVGRPPGAPLDLPLAINFGLLPLRPASRFVWRLSIDGETKEDWQVGFMTRPSPGSEAPALGAGRDS